MKHERKKWTLVLDRYERDNLLTLLQAIVGPKPGVDYIEPFSLAHTGDWTCQILNQLGNPHDPVPEPNQSLDELRKEVNLFVKGVFEQLRKKQAERQNP